MLISLYFLISFLRLRLCTSSASPPSKIVIFSCSSEVPILMLNELIIDAGGSHFQQLSWTLRLKISLGAARGLAFLHSTETKVIYRDFKTSNILLDTVSIGNLAISSYG